MSLSVVHTFFCYVLFSFFFFFLILLLFLVSFLQTIVELAETGSLDLSIFCSTCLVIFDSCRKWTILAEDVSISRTTFDCFCGLTDTEAHQIQTLRRVQPLHRQVWSPLSLGGELCRYVHNTTDVGDVKNYKISQETGHPQFSIPHWQRWLLSYLVFQNYATFWLLSRQHIWKAINNIFYLWWEPILIGIGQEAVYKLHKWLFCHKAETKGRTTIHTRIKAIWRHQWECLWTAGGGQNTQMEHE